MSTGRTWPDPCVAGGATDPDRCAAAEPGTPPAYGEPDRVDRDLELLRLASEHFRHDLQLFWQQTGFFAVLQGFFVTAVASALVEGEGKGPVAPVDLSSVIGGVAAVFCALWFCSGWRRLKLVGEWHRQVRHLDRVVDRHRVYGAIGTPIAPFASPSGPALVVPLLGGAAWIAGVVLLRLAA
jgi:hypothetical protein